MNEIIFGIADLCHLPFGLQGLHIHEVIEIIEAVQIALLPAFLKDVRIRMNRAKKMRFEEQSDTMRVEYSIQYA